MCELPELQEELVVSGWELVLPHFGNYGKSLHLSGPLCFSIQVRKTIFLYLAKEQYKIM